MTAVKTWSAEEELLIVLEGMVPRANISEVCRRHGISSTAYYEWRTMALAGMKQGPKTTPGGAETALRHENARLKKIVTECALINDCLQETGGATVGKRRRRELVKGLSNEGEVRTATLARVFHLARATRYYGPRPGPHRRLHVDKPRARDPVRRVAFDHPSFGYRRVSCESAPSPVIS